MTTEVYSPGLEGVIAGETAISTVVDGLRYRGYPVTELCQRSSFDEVAFLLLRGEMPAEAMVRALDVSLILYAEHEFNASTFTARVVTSTESDLHSAIVAAIGALKGRLHGGANEKVMDVLMAAGGPDTAERWLRAAMARKERGMGFGHRIYKAGDVRAGI